MIKKTLVLITAGVLFALPLAAQYDMLSITEEGLYYKNRLDVTDWKAGDDFVYVSPYYIPWNGEDSLDYENRMGELKVNGELVGVDLVEYSMTSINDKGKIVTVQADAKHLSELEKLPNLVAASLVGIKEEDLSNLSANDNLRALDLAYTKISDDGLKHISSMKSLRALNLAYTDVSDAGLAHLAELENLRSLDLESTEITDDGLAHLSKLDNLRSLNLFRTKTGSNELALRGRPLKVTDSGLKALSGMNSLKELNLHGSEVTDKGVETIVSMTNIHKLDLSATKITDACVPQLVKMGHLNELNVTGTEISTSGINSLIKSLPNCKINY